MISSNTHGSILPALAFSLDMFSKTDMSYGVNEVLLVSVLGSVVFAMFSAQPLVIVGVTGRLSVCYQCADDHEFEKPYRSDHSLQLYGL